MTAVERVLLVVAMNAEARPLVKALELVEEGCFCPPARCESYVGRRGGMEVRLVTCGTCATHGVDNCGTVPAALTTYLALEKYRPQLVLNVGTAGGFRQEGGCIGDVYLAHATAHHDRRIPLPGFDKYGVGHHELMDASVLRTKLGLKPGVVTTGNSLDAVDVDLQLMKKNGAHVKDMECAAIAWSAHLFRTPLIVIKAVTDLVDGGRPTQEEFLENLHTAADALQMKVMEALDFIEGKAISEL